jgi:tetratricopeptide (TPR) repeat protein
MTPEEIRDAFRRYDLIIGVFTLLMAFFAASFVATAPDLWLRAASGERILQSPGTLPTMGSFAYTARPVAGVDPSWLYNVLSASLLRVGDVALVGSKVAVVVVSILVLLAIRYPAASLHWPIWCIGWAIVAMSGRIDVGPTIVSYLLLAVLLWLGHRAHLTQRAGYVLAALPLLILWANLDIAYPIGGAVMLAIVLGDGWFGGSSVAAGAGEKRRLSVPVLLGASVVAIGAGLVSPFGLANWTFPWRMIPLYQKLPSLDYGWDGWTSIVEAMRQGNWSPSLVAWVLLALMAAGVLLVGFQRLSITRVLLFLIALGVVTCERWVGLSAMILATIASQGGQEFAVRNFKPGVQTSGWGLVRAQLVVVVLLLSVFVGMIGALTGRMQQRIAQFGFGIDRSEFAEETSRWLASSGLRGRGISIGSGGRLDSYLAYARPGAQAFVDLRWPSEAEAFSLFERVRISLTGFDSAKANDWKQTFAKLGITHIVVDAREETNIMRTIRQGLSRRSDLAPLAVDDQAIVYGWLSDEHEDYARVKELRLQTNALAFRSKREPPVPTDRTVTAPSLIDTLWPIRMTARPAGLIKGTFFSTGGRWLSQPGSAVLATSYLRSAVSANPDNPDAHLRLGLAYMTLIQTELAALPPEFESTPAPAPQPTAGASPTGAATEGASAEASGAKGTRMPARLIPSDVVLTRHHQAMAALQNALVAGADRWKEETALGVHTAMALACRQNRFMDLWLKHLREQRRFVASADQRQVVDGDIAMVEKEVKQRFELYQRQIDQLSQERRAQATRLEGEIATRAESIKTANETDRRRLEGEVEMIRRQVSLLRADAERDRPLENAQVAFALDLPGKAVEEIEKVPATSPEAEGSADFVVRVYLRVGMPDKAADRLRLMRGASRLGPGVYSWLSAQTALVSGQFEAAKASLEQAMAEVNAARLRDTIDSGFAKILQGRLVAPDGAIPFNEAIRSVTSGGLESSFLYDLAMVQIELAQNEPAMESFRRILDLSPGFKLSPIIDFYAKVMSDKPLPRTAVPTAEDEVAIRFPDPPMPDPVAPPADPGPATLAPNK